MSTKVSAAFIATIAAYIEAIEGLSSAICTRKMQSGVSRQRARFQIRSFTSTTIVPDRSATRPTSRNTWPWRGGSLPTNSITFSTIWTSRRASSSAHSASQSPRTTSTANRLCTAPRRAAAFFLMSARRRSVAQTSLRRRASIITKKNVLHVSRRPAASFAATVVFGFSAARLSQRSRVYTRAADASCRLCRLRAGECAIGKQSQFAHKNSFHRHTISGHNVPRVSGGNYKRRPSAE